MATISEPRQLLVNDLKAMLYVEQKLADAVLPQLENEIQNSEFRQSIAMRLRRPRPSTSRSPPTRA